MTHAVKVSTCKHHIRNAIDKRVLPREYSSYIDQLCEGAVRGRDVECFRDVKEWISWLAWATVVLDERDYLLAAVHALDLAQKLAGTDYGTSRQRDLGQLWTDTIRGFLGEIAFVKWLEARFNVKAELDYRKGELAQFLPSDIKSVNGRRPRLNISIKTTKLKGIWLDIPYAQIRHSDIFILVRVGVTREHFVAFLKEISAIRDKILKKAMELGILSEEEMEKIWNSVPKFSKIPAYIVGFFDKHEYGKDVENPESIFVVSGRRGTKNFTINTYVGFWNPKERRYEMKIRTLLSLPNNVAIKFEGIQDFTKTLHFIVSSGMLKRKESEWRDIIERL